MQPNTFIKTLTMIHGSLLAGLVLFTGFVYWQGGSFIAEMNGSDFFIYLVPIAAAMGYFLGKFLFEKNLATIHKEDSLGSKLTTYQMASLIQYALIEGPAFLALIAYYQNGNALHLVIAISLAVYLFALRPKQQRIENILQLAPDEKSRL